MWQYLVEHAKDFGFLGPIVGIVGLLLGASGAILFGWSRALDTWKPPKDTFPEGLEKIVGLLSAVGLFVAWILAEPKNGPAYLHAAIWLAIGSVIAFLIYVGLWAYCGRFRKPLVGQNNKPSGEDVVWGGFCVWKHIRAQTKLGQTIEDILKGNGYDRSKVWPPISLVLSAVITALVLISVLVCGTIALSTAGASIQVALTGKPARTILSSLQVPGLTAPTPTASPTPTSTSTPTYFVSPTTVKSPTP